MCVCVCMYTCHRVRRQCVGVGSLHYVVFEVDRLDRSHIYLLSDVTDPFVFHIIYLFKNYMLGKRILNVFS